MTGIWQPICCYWSWSLQYIVSCGADIIYLLIHLEAIVLNNCVIPYKFQISCYLTTDNKSSAILYLAISVSCREKIDSRVSSASRRIAERYIRTLILRLWLHVADSQQYSNICPQQRTDAYNYQSYWSMTVLPFSSLLSQQPPGHVSTDNPTVLPRDGLTGMIRKVLWACSLDYLVSMLAKVSGTVRKSNWLYNRHFDKKFGYRRNYSLETWRISIFHH